MFTSIFSAHIEENQGFDNPEDIIDIEGWTVWKQQQSEIYLIKHNLGLTDPKRQLHVVASPTEENTILTIINMESDQFIISTRGLNGESKNSAFMFTAIQSS